MSKRAVALVCAWLTAWPLTTKADERADAQAAFLLGVSHYDKKEWALALASFERSTALLPTKGASMNIATCLRRLHRFDEALEAYRGVLSKWSASLTAAERLEMENGVVEITPFVATLRITGAPPGATVFVDGRERGVTPIEDAIQVSVGTRQIRVEKPGFAPYETKLILPSGGAGTLAVTMSVVTERGRLRVVEKAGKRFDVRVDGVAVGQTPWEGDVAAGEHAISLSGEGDDGSAIQAVRVVTNERVTVELEAIKQPGKLRVEPTPPDATVWIDGKQVGHGTWAGEVASGEHVIEVRAAWYVTQTVSALVSSREPRDVRVELDPVRRTQIAVFGGATLFPLYDAPNVPAATPPCCGAFVGARAGYLFFPWFGVELFLIANMDLVRNVPPEFADVKMSAGGVSTRFVFFDPTPLTIRLWTGLARGNAESEGFFAPIGGPEIRFGYRFTSEVSLDVGVAALGFWLPAVTASHYQLSGGFGMAFPASVALQADF